MTIFVDKNPQWVSQATTQTPSPLLYKTPPLFLHFHFLFSYNERSNDYENKSSGSPPCSLFSSCNFPSHQKVKLPNLWLPLQSENECSIAWTELGWSDYNNRSSESWVLHGLRLFPAKICTWWSLVKKISNFSWFFLLLVLFWPFEIWPSGSIMILCVVYTMSSLTVVADAEFYLCVTVFPLISDGTWRCFWS